MTTVRDALRGYADRLEAAGVDSPRLCAEVLLAHAMGRDRMALITEGPRPITASEREQAETLIARRETGEPVAYITGVKEFYGLDFAVTPATLIPRPETEHIIERVQEVLPADSRFHFLDLGTGSGILTVTLAVLFPLARGTAVDLSPEALDVAARNAERHGVADRIEFLHADFTQPLAIDGVDLVVANPPYVSEQECERMSHEVSHFEPMTALFSPEDGLAHFRGLLPQAKKALKPGGMLLMEMGCDQGSALTAMLAEPGAGFHESVIISDLAGLERVVQATRCGRNETVFAR